MVLDLGQIFAGMCQAKPALTRNRLPPKAARTTFQQLSTTFRATGPDGPDRLPVLASPVVGQPDPDLDS